MSLSKSLGLDRFGAGRITHPAMAASARASGNWSMACMNGQAPFTVRAEYDRLLALHGRDRALDFASKEGMLKWYEEWHNIMTNVGRDYAIDAYLSGGTPITSWFVGIVNGATPTFDLADTMASHAGWTEEQNYDEATRVAWVEAGVSAGVVTNSASVAVFTINSSVTVGGAFLVSESTKGGTAGTLYAEGDFPTDRTLIATDELQVTATMSLADDGV